MGNNESLPQEVQNAVVQDAVREPIPLSRPWFKSEDWLAVCLGVLLILVSLAFAAAGQADNLAELDQAVQAKQSELRQLPPLSPAASDAEKKERVQAKQALDKELAALNAKLQAHPLSSYAVKLGEWSNNPTAAFYKKDKPLLPGLLGTFGICLAIFTLGAFLAGETLRAFIPGFIALFLLAVLAYILAGQEVLKYYNLEYALWAIVLGMVICNTVGTPRLLKPALKTELYIKTGLVLLGSEILLSRLLVLGLPGIFVSWVVTPITLISTYIFGQYILRVPSKSLNMVISADMSVCGVSAAIATAAACKAKKEELSLAIGLSLAFTVIMMIVMPAFIRAVGMSDVLAGAWLGGTIDSTGAVAAAGAMLESQTALEVAMTVKMVQNILIGVVAFGVAVYWVTYVERDPNSPRPQVSEIWRRFPRFIIGFVGASLIASAIYASGLEGRVLVESSSQGFTKTMHGWLFCLAFVSIGLETNFRELAQFMKGGKPLILYVCGQALNLLLTFAMAWLMFVKVFPQAAELLAK